MLFVIFVTQRGNDKYKITPTTDSKDSKDTKEKDVANLKKEVDLVRVNQQHNRHRLLFLQCYDGAVFYISSFTGRSQVDFG